MKEVNSDDNKLINFELKKYSNIHILSVKELKVEIVDNRKNPKANNYLV